MQIMQLSEFLERHAAELAAAVAARWTPEYDPARPPAEAGLFADRIARLARPLFPVQAELAQALAVAAYRRHRRRLMLCGEQGCGKTTIALAVVAAADRPQRALVVCPTHLVAKWMREAQAVIPDVRTVDLTVRDVISRLDELRRLRRSRPAGPEVYVLGKERAKLSYAWRAAAWMRPGRGPHCPACGAYAQDREGGWLDETLLATRRYGCGRCGEPLWQADGRLRRMAPVEWMKRRLRGFFDWVILDEVHELKGGDTLQGRAMGGLLRLAPRALGLTGTLASGYADDLFHLLFRLSPAAVLADGFSAKASAAWLERYGVLEIVRELEDGDDHCYGRGRKRRGIVRRKPGVSPVVIGRHLLDKTAFVRLADVADRLPPFEERVETVPLPDELAAAYRALEADLRRALREHGMKSVGAMLQALLAYPDEPGAGDTVVIRAKDGAVVERIEAPRLRPSDGNLWPKEAWLRELVADEREAGRKVLVYLSFTDRRDLRPRLLRVLREAGFRADSLDATVEPKRREAWIAGRQDDLDVLLVQPELVKTGLDLYAFPTILFYQVGYNLFTLRQAARRSWRIGQTEPVRVLYMAYRGTMQETALALMARKLEVATWVEGDLPEGLADYGQVQAGLREELVQALRDGRGVASAEAAWMALRRREAAVVERLDRSAMDRQQPAKRISMRSGSLRLCRVDDRQLALF